MMRASDQQKMTVCNISSSQESPRKFSDDIAEAVAVLKRGGIILYPTDTVWGIGCDATNPEAVKRIYNLKRRTDTKAMLVLVNSEAMLERCVESVPDVAYELLEAVVNPTTIIYDNAMWVAPEIIGEDGSLGIRLTSERYSAELCRRLNRPIVSTSANLSGAPSARFFHEITPEIVKGVDYVAHYRRDDIQPAKPSSIIKLSNSGVVKIIRR